jgi:hypothetical protein
MKTIMCLGVLAMLAGCDGSKVELETAKTNLANVTRERDDLKVQVATLQQQASGAKADLAKEKAAEAQATDKNGKAPIASKSGPAEAPTPAKSKHAHKS